MRPQRLNAPVKTKLLSRRLKRCATQTHENLRHPNQETTPETPKQKKQRKRTRKSRLP
jgi:hypothetical protein